MTLEKFVEVAIKQPGRKRDSILARVGAINEFHFVNSQGILFLRSDKPVNNQRDGEVYDKEGYTYTPCELDKDSLTYKMNGELIEKSIALLEQYSKEEEARRIQEEESNLKSYQRAFGITSTSVSY